MQDKQKEEILFSLHFVVGKILLEYNNYQRRLHMSVFFQEVMLGIDTVFQNLVFINLILSVIIVFFQRKDPKSVWAWLLLMYTIPILGFVIYLLAGTDMHKSKMFKTKEIEDQLNEAIREQEFSILSKEMEELFVLIKMMKTMTR